MKKEKSCGFLIIKKENDLIKILILKHKIGHWGFPKGHIKKGETEIETAIRETKEEINLDVKIINNFRKKVTYSPKEGTIKDVIYYLGEPIGKEKIDNKEIVDHMWINIDEIGKFIIYQDHIEIVKELSKFLKDIKF